MCGIFVSVQLACETYQVDLHDVEGSSYQNLVHRLQQVNSDRG
jgi:hypothetical protein